jgi:hypothetical protein
LKQDYPSKIISAAKTMEIFAKNPCHPLERKRDEKPHIELVP